MLHIQGTIPVPIRQSENYRKTGTTFVKHVKVNINDLITAHKD